MKITLISDGPYGDRATEHIRTRYPDTNIFYINEVDQKTMLDEYEFESEVETAIESSDLIISYIRHPDIILELCYFKKPTIVAIFRGSGLLNQIRDINKDVIMPPSMCSIEPTTNIKAIDEFAQFFGKPIYEFEYDFERKIIKNISLLRESPCGATARALKFIENKTVKPKNIDDYAIFIVHECKESVAYRLAQSDTSSAATFNHVFPLIDKLKKLDPSLFEEGSLLFNYEEKKLNSADQGKL